MVLTAFDVVDSVPESLSDFGDLTLSPQPASNLALYLIVSLSTISLIFLVAIIVLAVVKCYKDRETISGYNLPPFACCCCGGFQPDPPPEVFKKSNLNLQISSAAKVPTNCMEVNGNSSLSQSYCYKVCLTPESAKSDFMFLKPCSPGSTPRNNEAKSAENSWNAQSRSASVNNGATTPNELKQPNTDWTLTKNQNSSIKSYNSINMDGTLMRKAMHADPENYVTSMGPGQYWTWGTHMRGMKDYKMSPSTSGVPSRPWTPRCTPPPQQQQPSIPPHPHPHPPPHPPPDYHHNVYIPGTPSGFCTLRPAAPRSELDVHNSFSTFGKKRRLQMSPQGEAAIINNDLYND
ncbi:hypothetical protein EPR50_G00108180 [Perca flavescens]|uniref:Cadherin cytoplasmic C-terminal domain-containing protein n=1 Tax=Perca flavescens TaxID=8167 RepID=A0A484CX71_PERFV|nr:hypothetical protein EPR50_G00108180 [Perca flavescens]